MGLFKKTLSDIEKYRAAGDVKRLCETLEAKDSEIALAAFRALRELDRPDVYVDMANQIAASPHAEIKREFESFIASKGGPFAKPLAEALILELKRLVLSGSLLLASAQKQIMEGRWPGSIQTIESWLAGLKDAALPELRERLGHKEFLARVLCAEILERWDDPDSREWRHDTLARRDIVFRKLEFDTKALLGATEPGEVPLGRASVCTLKNKTFELGLYTLGLTDEAVHIVAEYGIVVGVRLGKWRIPLSRVRSLGLSAEEHLELDLDALVMNPADLGGPETSRLAFKPFKRKDAVRLRRIIEIWTALKQGKISKAEIADTLYDKKLVSFMDF
jgi:hypothetical protein